MASNKFQLVVPEPGQRAKHNVDCLTVSCYLSPPISAVAMEINWHNETTCVCHYKNGQLTEGIGYEGRASLFKSDLVKGNVSLRLKDFTHSDMGAYICQVTSRNHTREITVDVSEEFQISKKMPSFTADYKMKEQVHKSSSTLSKDLHRVCRMQASDENIKLSSHSTYHDHSDKRSPSNDNFQLVMSRTIQEGNVSLGSELIISCHLSPEISAVAMEICWYNDTGTVCLYKDRQVTAGFAYKGRASLFTHELNRGNVSLKLQDFRSSDVGNYYCKVICGDRTKEAKVKVRLHSDVQSPSQSPIYEDRNAVVLNEDENMTETTNTASRCASDDIVFDTNRCENNKTGATKNDNFQLVVPGTAQKAEVSSGSEFTVPCYLSSETSVFPMEIRWFKETECVCLYKKSEVTEGRSYKGRVSLFLHELERGNVSLTLRNFSCSDVGDYHCQVTSRNKTIAITVGVRENPEVPKPNQAQTSQRTKIKLMLCEVERIWTEEEVISMEESALMAEMKVNNAQGVYQKIIMAYRKQSRQLENTELELREIRMDLDRALRFQDRDKNRRNPF